MPDPDDNDPTEWNPSDDPTDYPEFWDGTDAASEILDKVIDGEASDAKAAIFSALYHKVGERIDGLRGDIRNDIRLSSDEPTEPPVDGVADEEIPFGNDTDEE
jgi:hypothetical protein